MTLHTNPYSEVSYDPGVRLLTMVWQKNSSKLDEDGIKAEIGTIVRFVKEYGIRNVIVDSRDYSFRNHPALQEWITRSYIPRIMDSAVIKYAIVVTSDVMKDLGAFDADPDIVPAIGYFTSLGDAQQWIKS